jgi:hypothetical protein
VGGEHPPPGWADGVGGGAGGVWAAGGGYDPTRRPTRRGTERGAGVAARGGVFPSQPAPPPPSPVRPFVRSPGYGVWTVGRGGVAIPEPMKKLGCGGWL